MNIVLRKLTLGAGLIFMLATGLGGVLATPTPVYAADNYCIDGDGQIRPDSLAPCLDPTPQDKDKVQDYAWITDMWNWSLSLVNIFAALVLITMAFANILYPWQALEQFRIRQLLPTFIWGVILANASLFICRAVVTLADLLMSSSGLKVDLPKLFLNFGFDPGLLSLGTVPAMFGTQQASGVGDLIYQLIISVIFIFLPVLGLIFLSFIFYFRTALIFILTALSPLAFASIIFPPTRNFLGKWWDWFWKWTFGGVASWVVLYAASLITVSKETLNQGGITTDILPYFISLSLIYMAIMAPFKMGGAIAGTIERLGKQGWGKTVGATKFVGAQAYRHTGLGATRYKASSQANLDAAQKAHDADPSAANKARLALAQSRMKNATDLHDLVRLPSTVTAALGARQSLDDSLLKKGDFGSNTFEGIAGRKAALMARKDDYEGIEKSPDIEQQKKAISRITSKYNLDPEKAYEFFSASPTKRAELSEKYKMSTDDALELKAASTGYFYNKRPGASGKGLDYMREAMGEAAPAGSDVGARNVGVTQFRQAHLEDAVSDLQGLTQVTDPRLIRNAIEVASAGGSLNQARFKQELQQHISPESLTPEMDNNVSQVLSEYQRKLNRLTTQPIDATMAAKVTADWAAGETDANEGDYLETIREMRDNSKKALEALADGDGALEVDAGDREVIAKFHPKMLVKIDGGEIKTKDDLRHKLEEQFVGAQKIDSLITKARSDVEKKLNTELAANPQIVHAKAGLALKIAAELAGDVNVSGLKGADLQKLEHSFKKMKGNIAKAQLHTLAGGEVNVEGVKSAVAKISQKMADEITDAASAQHTVSTLATGFDALGQSVKEAYQESRGGADGIAATLTRQYR